MTADATDTVVLLAYRNSFADACSHLTLRLGIIKHTHIMALVC
jgi:hypothetical protein